MSGNNLYPSFKDARNSGLVDLTSDTVKVLRVTAAAVFDPADDFLDDIAGGDRIGSGVTVVLTVGGGVVEIDPFTTPGVAAAPNTGGLVFFIEAGSDATRRLIGHATQRADTTTIDAGSTVDVTWDFTEPLLT